ncbi:MAG: hypothetical protein ACKOYM_03685 [Actinomycetes bacterium]
MDTKTTKITSQRVDARTTDANNQRVDAITTELNRQRVGAKTASKLTTPARLQRDALDRRKRADRVNNATDIGFIGGDASDLTAHLARRNHVLRSTATLSHDPLHVGVLKRESVEEHALRKTRRDGAHDAARRNRNTDRTLCIEASSDLATLGGKRRNLLLDADNRRALLVRNARKLGGTAIHPRRASKEQCCACKHRAAYTVQRARCTNAGNARCDFDGNQIRLAP